MNCEICTQQDPSFSWTDAHGIAQCFTCGAPYRLFHYEEGKRVDKPPSLCIKPEFVEACQRYWTETKRRMPSGFGFAGQEIASRKDAEQFSKWWNENVRETENENANV